MSFWVSTTKYRRCDNNGTTFLNVGGVPGGLDNRELYPIQEALHKENWVITPLVVKKAIKCFGAIDSKSLLQNHLTNKSKNWWFKSLHGKSDDVEEDFNWPGATYLVWWLHKNQGQKINSRFSY